MTKEGIWLDASKVANFICLIEKELEMRGLTFAKGKVKRGTYISGGNWISTKNAELTVEKRNGKVKITLTTNGKRGFLVEFFIDKEDLEKNAEAFAIILYAWS